MPPPARVAATPVFLLLQTGTLVTDRNSKTCWLTSQRSVFDEKIRCDVCLEEAYYATNNGLARPFSGDRWVDKCPGCLGPPGAKTATDRTKAWSMRV